MRLIPHGAAREVTGTCHELQVGNTRILLDCGLFQGRRAEAAVKNSTFPFKPTDIDAVVLSHAHMDHAGRIPLLWKKGYRGPVFCTYATKDLAAVMLEDGGYVQEKDEEYFCKHLKKSMVACDGPLYTQEDAKQCQPLFKPKNYNEWFEVVPGIRVKFLDAGHILGAAMLVIEAEERGLRRYIGFSADLGRAHLPIIHDPEAMDAVEILICESTYGNRRHESILTARGKLKETLLDTAKRGGKVIIPAFSLERTQEIVYDLHLLWDNKEIPAMPIIIDSPLATKVTDVFMRHPECYDKEMYEEFLQRQHNPFQFSLVKYTESVEDSKALNGARGPMVIMAGSGMCEAGRIRHHLRNELEDPRNTVLAVGYMAKDTLGSKIFDPSITHVKIFDEMVAKKAQCTYIDAYSGHADMNDLDGFVADIGGMTYDKDTDKANPVLEKVILVHGESEGMEAFAKRIRDARGIQVLMPEREEVIEL
jgi:metallo-beta-lactamase family protein